MNLQTPKRNASKKQGMLQFKNNHKFISQNVFVLKISFKSNRQIKKKGKQFYLSNEIKNRCHLKTIALFKKVTSKNFFSVFVKTFLFYHSFSRVRAPKKALSEIFVWHKKILQPYKL